MEIKAIADAPDMRAIAGRLDKPETKAARVTKVAPGIKVIPGIKDARVIRDEQGHAVQGNTVIRTPMAA
jgi:hypothetical protein